MEKGETYEAQLRELNYSYKWKKRKHVVAETDLDAPTMDTYEDDNIKSIATLVTIRWTSARVLNVA